MMMNQPHHPTSRSTSSSARRGSVYLATLSSVGLITVLAVSAYIASGLETHRGALAQESREARRHARSAIELGLAQIDARPDWRDAALGSNLFTNISIGGDERLSLAVTDPPAYSATDTPCDPVFFVGVGAVGDAIQRTRVQVAPLLPDRAIEEEILDLRPTGYWPLRRDGTLAATDLSDEENHGTIRGNPEFNSTGLPGCYDCVGFGDAGTYIEIEDDGVWFQDRRGSIAFWFYATRWDLSDGLVTKEAALPGGPTIGISVLGGSLVATHRFDVLSLSTLSVSRPDAGAWHHVAYVWKNRDLCLFLNGVLVDTETAPNGVDTEPEDEPLVIGGSTSTSGTGIATPVLSPFDGFIAHVAVFDTDLKSDEVEDLAELTPQPIGWDIEPGTWTRHID